MPKKISINQYLQNSPEEALENISKEICIKDVANYWQKTPKIEKKDLLWCFLVNIEEIEDFSVYFINPKRLNNLSVQNFNELSPIFQLMIVLSINPQKQQLSFTELKNKI